MPKKRKKKLVPKKKFVWTIFGLLLVVLVGVGAVITVLFTLKNKTELKSQASSAGCTAIHDAFEKFDTNFWTMEGEGTVDSKNGILRVVESADSHQGVRLVGKPMLIGDFRAKLIANSVRSGLKRLPAVLKLDVTGGSYDDGSYVSASIEVNSVRGKDYIRVNVSRFNESGDDPAELDWKEIRLDFPVDITVERWGADFAFYYAEKDKPRRLLREYKNYTNATLYPVISVWDANDDRDTEGVRAELKGFNVDCMLKK